MRFSIKIRRKISMCLKVLTLLSLSCVVLATPAIPQVASSNEVSDEQLIARQAYEDAIAGVSNQQGKYAMELIEPMLGLARADMLLGNLEQAKHTLQQAQQITHMNDGVYTTRQMEIIDLLIDVALSENQPFNADEQQKFLYYIQSKKLDSLDLLPAQVKFAKWYIGTGQYRKASAFLNRTIEMIESTAGEYDLRLIEPLQMKAQLRRLKGACCSDKILQRTLAILEKNNTATADTQAKVYLQMADAYLANRRKEDLAAQYYILAAASNPGLAGSLPKLIPMSKKLRAGLQRNPQMFRVREDPFTHQSYTKKLSIAEQLQADQQPPQQFVFYGDYKTYGITLRENSASTTAEVDYLVGNPFQFNQQQVLHIIGYGTKKSAKLGNIAINLDFTVTETGQVKNIEIENSNAPSRLNRLMNEVLHKARYRPALVDGKPVSSDHVLLRQTF